MLTLALALVATGCGAWRGITSLSGPKPCLSGPRPVMGRLGADADYAVLRERWEALPALPPLAQAALLPGLASWVPDVSDRSDEPSCKPEIDERMAEVVLGERPVVLSRLLLSRLVASGAHDLLERVAALREDQFTVYVPLPEEPPGHAISAAEVRATAARILVWQDLHRDDAAARAAVIARLLAGDEARTLFDLDARAYHAVSGDLYRVPTLHVQGEAGRRVLRRELGLLRAWLEAPHDGARFELALRWIRRFGRYGAHYGMAAEIMAVIAPVIARRGDVPLARGQLGADEDLWLVGLRAEYDLRHPSRLMGAGLALPRRSAVVFAPPSHLGEVRLQVAAGTPLSAKARGAILKLLDEQLRAATYSFTRCRLLRERVAFSLSEDRLAALLPRLPETPETGPVRFDEEPLCALELLEKPVKLDAAALHRVLALAALPVARAVPVQPVAPGGYGQVITVLSPGDLASAAGRVLLDHAEEIAAEAEGLAWLEAAARSDAAGEGPMGLRTSGLRAAEVLVPRWLASEPARAGELLRQWMTTSLAALRGPPPSDLDTFERLARTQYLLARWAPPAGLRDEAASHFAQARTLIRAWMGHLADGATELDGIFALCDAMLARPVK